MAKIKRVYIKTTTRKTKPLKKFKDIAKYLIIENMPLHNSVKLRFK